MKSLLIFLMWLCLFPEVQTQTPIPESCLGRYQGNLNIYNGEKKQEIAMEFHLLATDSAYLYDYHLIYIPNDSVRDERLYTLRYIPDSRTFEVDEHNGIKLSASFVDYSLYSIFEVQGGLLTSVIRFYGDEAELVITYSSKNRSVTTGGLSENIPEVISYPVGSVQKARLVKMAGHGKP